MAGPTHAFELFLESFHAPHTDRRYADDFHLGALSELKLLERERAERLLITRLAGDPDDDRIPGALALIGTAASFKPLRDALDKATGLARVRIAEALRRLGAEYDPTADFVEAIRTGDFATRGAAVRALAAGPREETRGPLVDALDDPNFAVRIEAFEALLELYDLRAAKQAPMSPLSTVGMRLLSDLAAVAQPAAAEMRAIVGSLDAGRTPRQLGLTDLPVAQAPAIERVLTSLFGPRTPPWERDLDLEALNGLYGGARRYVENVLLAELHAGDPRVPRALAAMGATTAAGALKEALASARGALADGEWGTAVREALRRFGVE